MSAGFDALEKIAGLIDLSPRGRIRVTGEDRARLLHAMSTNHIQGMKPGEHLYAFFLNAQGRILADAAVLCREDSFLLDTEPETRQSLYEHIDRYIIADDVTLEDVTAETFCLGVEGPRAHEIVDSTGISSDTDLILADVSATGGASVRIYGPIAKQSAITGGLLAAGAVEASADDAQLARIAHFRPRYGDDITEANLPQETQQTAALHFTKGCYLGQEIVERVRSRGHVNKHLMGFRLEGDAVPERGAQLFAGGKECGEVTSAAACPDGRIRGLANVTVPYEKPGTTVGINGRPGELVAPFGAQ
jgi:folate-binding protein YgfZ